jgi:hypothetical protein
VESFFMSTYMYLTTVVSEPTKLLYPRQKPRRGGGAQTDKKPAAKSLYRSIFKKSRQIGLESISYLVHALPANSLLGELRIRARVSRDSSMI